MKHPIGVTRNNKSVFVNMIGSPASARISQQPRILSLVNDMLPRISLHGEVILMEYDMGRAVGYNYVVPTTEKDTILYACLVRDPVYTRFVKNGKPDATQYVSVHFRKVDNEYELHDAWIGQLRPARPGSDDETADSKEYWQSHAYIFDNQSIQSQTVTKQCPYEIEETSNVERTIAA